MEEVRKISFSSLVLVPLVILSGDKNATITLSELREYKLAVANAFAKRLERVQIGFNKEEQDYFEEGYVYWVKTNRLESGEVVYSLRKNVGMDEREKLLNFIDAHVRKVLESCLDLVPFSLGDAKTLKKAINAC